jgi:hypothetical protein
MLCVVSDKDRISEFLRDNPIAEPFNYAAEYIFGDVDQGLIKGLVAYMLDDYNRERVMPRYIHVILGRDLKRRRRLLALLRFAEDYLRDIGYTECFAYILRNNEPMIRYAEKWGFRKTYFTPEAWYLHKKIGG